MFMRIDFCLMVCIQLYAKRKNNRFYWLHLENGPNNDSMCLLTREHDLHESHIISTSTCVYGRLERLLLACIPLDNESL